MAVGRDGGTGISFVDTWDGTSWSAAPALPVDDVMHSLSCVAADACTAVGTDPFNVTAEAFRWDGSSWGAQTVPQPPDPRLSSALSGVSCATAASCEAVGYSHLDPHGFGAEQRAVGLSGGAWKVQNTPSGIDESLSGVSCPAAGACLAVGGGLGGSIVERLSGSSWVSQTTPTSSTTGAALAGISCPTRRSCTAVGNIYDSSTVTTSPLIQRWAGGPAAASRRR